MKRKQLYQPMELFISENENWQESALIYHFFEILQIMDGSGQRIVNENNHTYGKGDIFLFTPMDCRGFKSREPTKFCSIRFSEVFLTSETNPTFQNNRLSWLKQLEQIFYNHNRYESVVIQSIEDCQMITNLISNIIIEHDQKGLCSQQHTQQYITLILNILSRNLTTKPNPGILLNDEPLINKILTHIKKNIGNPGQLKTTTLAKTFNISKNYIGEYFKKLTGETLQHYISLYKMKYIEQRLLYSDYTIGQISDELGFTDESHLSRQFKKYKGMSPSKYRQEKKALY
ncbi:AraC family transcriptional regulator [Galbibacter pacificus]|uniref:AraC family transcriptional regulator n=1 Tax=Galbibacter pacificus TaxID=2996052 RepID=A0ABT6FN39_9FLAO|nr:AraC family transcriptional regulator [Galbibacter pacificus]MDG3581197.1 AraC family transcriptional regulator [Galbibacter pacificus]MDG3584675.1 AraC family transcriptional regulator [Galbibacter pacificus]